MESKLKDRLKIRDGKLNALLELTNAINANLSNLELFDHYKKVITVDLGIPQFALFIKNEDWACVTQNAVSPLQINQIIANATSFEENTLSLTDWGTSGSLDVVLPILKDEQSIAFIFLGDGDDEKLNMSPSVKHMRFVQTLTSILVVAIENKKLQEQSIKQAAMQRELELAAEMQNMLLPKNLPNTEKIKVTALYQAHGEVGGDYYDFFYINNNEWISCMADVSGKGISAAFLMAGLQSHLKIIFSQQNISLETAIESLNKKVMESSGGEKFVTFFVSKYNEKSGVFEYVNCGHNAPLLRTKQTAQWLNPTIPGLGMLDILPSFHSIKIQIDHRFELISYTDGLVEIENEHNVAFGETNIAGIAAQFSGAEFISEILKTVNTFKGSRPFTDDLAILHIDSKP